MRTLLLPLALVAPFALASTTVADDSSRSRPLDLPSGGVGATDEDEDAPETVHFLGTEYEGEAFFWCFHAFNF